MRPNSKKYVSPRIRIQPGKASRIIQPFSVTPGDLIVLALRKSGRERGFNLDDAESNLRRAVESKGGVVVEVVRHVGSGFYPFWVARAAAISKQHGATLLAESTDRFIRHPGYHSNDFADAQAREVELLELERDADGVRLMTHLHPDATPREVRSYQSKRGQREKGRMGGRPINRTPGYKKKRQQEKIGLVLWLHRRGWSIRRIAAERMVGVPKSTVSEWIQKHT